MMQQFLMEYSLPVIQGGDLVSFEKSFNIKLPQNYREFLLRHNGGRPEPSVFKIKEYPSNDNIGVVDTFLGISEKSEDSLQNYIKAYSNRLPKNIIPIAYDPGGNLICISIE